MDFASNEHGDLFHHVFDELGDEWFLLLENNEQEQNLPVGSDTLLNRVRSMVETWQALGITAAHTIAWHKPGRLSLGVDISDLHPIFDKSQERMVRYGLATLRIDYFGTSIRAAWVESERSDHDEMPEPQDGMTLTIEPSARVRGINEAVAWLEAQARRPIHRLEWTRDGEMIARLWRLADTGRELARSGGGVIWAAPPAPGWEGPPELRNPQTANSVLQVHP